ncbi:MAG TPA: TolC family protein [Myxococcota bacterium]|jgi:outer membrane protein TolC|nr:TolC family protein [Myxococcota bacterium]
MRSTFRVSLALLLASLVAAPAHSADPSSSPAPPAPPTDGAQSGSPSPPERASTLPPTGKIPLSLQRAIELGLRKNLAVEIARFDPAVAREKVGEAWGAYDPLFDGDFGYSSTETPSSNPLVGGQGLKPVNNKATDGNLGLSGLIPNWGATYNIGYAGQRLDTNQNFTAYDPQLTSSLIASLDVPLLRNFLYDAADTQLEVSRLGVDTADESFRTALMDVVQAVEVAYWQVIASFEQLRVADKSLETATKLLDQVKTQYEVGVVSKVDVVEAEAGVYERQFDQIVAKTNYRQAQDTLIDLIYGQEFRAGDQVEIDPTDQPEGDILYDTDLNVIMAKANAKRPELAAAQKNVEIQNVNLTFAKNQQLPKFDVVGTYGYAGLAGDPRPVQNFQPPPKFVFAPNQGRNFGNTNDDYFTRDGALQWSAKGVVSIPILNETARKKVSQGELELRKAKTDTVRVEQRIVLEVRQAVRNLEAAKAAIQAAEGRRRSAAEQLRAEEIRQEQGESTPFDVLLRERDLVQAEGSKIEAQRVYRTSATNLDRAQGTILESHRIEVEKQRQLR